MDGDWYVSSNTIMFWAFVELWPKTPVGKRLIVTPEKAEEYVWSDAKNSDPKELVGALGTVVAELLPAVSSRYRTASTKQLRKGLPSKRKDREGRWLGSGRLVVVETMQNMGSGSPSQSFGLDRPANELNIDSLEG